MPGTRRSAMLQACDAMLLVGCDLACQGRSWIEVEMGQRYDEHLLGMFLLTEIEPAEDAAFVAAIERLCDDTSSRWIGAGRSLPNDRSQLGRDDRGERQRCFQSLEELLHLLRVVDHVLCPAAGVGEAQPPIDDGAVFDIFRTPDIARGSRCGNRDRSAASCAAHFLRLDIGRQDCSGAYPNRTAAPILAPSSWRLAWRARPRSRTE